MMNGHWTPIIVVLLIIITMDNVDGDCELKLLWGRNVTVNIHIQSSLCELQGSFDEMTTKIECC